MSINPEMNKTNHRVQHGDMLAKIYMHHDHYSYGNCVPEEYWKIGFGTHTDVALQQQYYSSIVFFSRKVEL